MNKVKQFELWQDCNFGCTFCSLGKVKTSKQFKKESIERARSSILSYQQGQYDILGFIGGEFFNGQMDDDLFTTFCQLMKIVNDKCQNNIIKEIWLNVSLLNKFPDQLKYVLENCLTEHKKLWLLTSYDTIGRFHTRKMLENWENNLEHIHEKYPDIRTNVTSILTDDFIKKYISGELDISDLKSKYKSTWFLKPTVKPDNHINKSIKEIDKIIPYFFTNQETFQEFLYVYKEREGFDEYQKLFSNDLRAEEVVKNYNKEHKDVLFIRNDMDEKFVGENNTGQQNVLPCGHSKIYQSYLNTDGCVLCDKLEIGML